VTNERREVEALRLGREGEGMTAQAQQFVIGRHQQKFSRNTRMAARF
jgi:hypothetical protein